MIFDLRYRTKFNGKHFIVYPIIYGCLVYSLNNYWLKNDLRYLYRDILKPQYKRYDDNLCTDPRNLDEELEKGEDLDKSVIHKLWLAAENKTIRGNPADRSKESNLNLIKRN